jgi:4-amino-4-deoxy-L-arabinose transferase-like glycosyltransferase
MNQIKTSPWDGHKMKRFASNITPHLRHWKEPLILAIVVVISLRVILGVMMGVSWTIVTSNIDLEAIDYQEIHGALPDYSTFPANVFLGVWLRWDALHYLHLAKLGYLQLSEALSTFYPLYPMLIKWIAYPLGNEYLLAGLILSTIATVAVFMSIYWLGKYHFGSETATWSLIALASYPTALFLIAPFTESLFLALTMGAFIAAYQGRWWLTGLLGFLASLTRGPGMLTIFAFSWIALDYLRQNRTIKITRWLISRGFWLSLPLLGSFSFLIWRSAAGLPPLTEIHERYSGFRWTHPLNGFLTAIQQWIKIRDFPTTLDLLSLIAFLILLACMIKTKRWRKPEWLLYMGANLLLFMSKESFIASSIQSTSRYVLVLFPAFLLIGEWLSRQSQKVRFLYLSISSSILVIFSSFYALWIFVG